MDNEKIFLCNYAVAFIDLLGQKNEMLDRYLPEDNEEAIKLVKKSVGRIVGMQKLFQTYFDSYNTAKSFYSLFPSDIQVAFPDFAPGKLQWQRFSDGFVIFTPLGKDLSLSPVNSIISILMASGLLCLTGLAGKSPVRAGIDIAWAVEYRPGELYGSAIAHSYNLESKVAQWPRVVIGDGLIDYLENCAKHIKNDLSSQYRSMMSHACLNMIQKDIDGVRIIHYLGKEFNKRANGIVNENIIDKATGIH